MKRVGLGIFIVLLAVSSVFGDAVTFRDELDALDSARWLRAGVWINGTPFANVWMPEHVTFSDGVMKLGLDATADDGTDCPAGCLNKPYASAAYRTHDYFGYGCFEARMKPVGQSGVVSALFTYNGIGNIPPGGDDVHDEIDIEFLGRDTTIMQANFYTQGWIGHEHLIDLGFDAAEAFHDYGFKWTAGGITWYVDGVEVHHVDNDPADPTPDIETGGAQKYFANVWPVDETAAGWAGAFTYSEPLSAEYDWIRYEAGETCTFSVPTAVQVSGISAETFHHSINNTLLFLSLMTGGLFLRDRFSEKPPQ